MLSHHMYIYIYIYIYIYPEGPISLKKVGSTFLTKMGSNNEVDLFNFVFSKKNEVGAKVPKVKVPNPKFPNLSFQAIVPKLQVLS